jgi:hypothetical protein
MHGADDRFGLGDEIAGFGGGEAVDALLNKKSPLERGQNAETEKALPQTPTATSAA